MGDPEPVLVLLAASCNSGQVACTKIAAERDASILALLELHGDSLWMHLSQIHQI